MPFTFDFCFGLHFLYHPSSFPSLSHFVYFFYFFCVRAFEPSLSGLRSAALWFRTPCRICRLNYSSTFCLCLSLFGFPLFPLPFPMTHFNSYYSISIPFVLIVLLKSLPESRQGLSPATSFWLVQSFALQIPNSAGRMRKFIVIGTNKQWIKSVHNGCFYMVIYLKIFLIYRSFFFPFKYVNCEIPTTFSYTLFSSRWL